MKEEDKITTSCMNIITSSGCLLCIGYNEENMDRSMGQWVNGQKPNCIYCVW